MTMNIIKIKRTLGSRRDWLVHDYEHYQNKKELEGQEGIGWFMTMNIIKIKTGVMECQKLRSY